MLISFYLIILLYFILSYLILFYSILIYFILFYPTSFYFILFYFILFYFILFYFILFYFILLYSFISFLVFCPIDPIIIIIAIDFNNTSYLPFLFEIANSVLLAGMITFHQYPPVTVIRAVNAKNPNLRILWIKIRFNHSYFYAIKCTIK